MGGVFLGLGSNLGDRLGNLRKAVKGLEARGIKVRRASSAYETAPLSLEDQPNYMNAVLEVETSFPPEELLRVCQEVEASLGRVRRERWGPRGIDIDILLYGAETVDEAHLTVPHPRLTERLFVLAPLLEIEPDAALPDGGRLSVYLGAASNQKVRKVKGVWIDGYESR
mgnify:CR=1 FL=1